jgi:hypothetical protein
LEPFGSLTVGYPIAAASLPTDILAFNKTQKGAP